MELKHKSKVISINKKRRFKESSSFIITLFHQTNKQNDSANKNKSSSCNQSNQINNENHRRVVPINYTSNHRCYQINQSKRTSPIFAVFQHELPGNFDGGAVFHHHVRAKAMAVEIVEPARHNLHRQRVVSEKEEKRKLK